MRKMIVILLCMVFAMAGCSKDALTGYLSALEETSNIPSGKKQVEVSINMDFNKVNMSAEDLDKIKYLEHMDFTLEVTHDVVDYDEKAIIKGYADIGGLGIDATLYADGENTYLYIPMLGGYVDLEQYQDTTVPNDDLGIKTDSDDGQEGQWEDYIDQGEEFQPIIDKFTELLTDKDVMKGERTYITTEDGQIKTTIYTVNLNETQLKELLREAVYTLTTQEISNSIPIISKEDKTDFLSEIDKMTEEFTLENFSSTAYVDFDGRLVRQDMELEIAIKNDGESGSLNRINVTVNITNSGLGEKQDMEFPEVTEDMLLEEGWEKSWN